MNLKKYLSFIGILILVFLICSCSKDEHRHDVSYDRGYKATCTTDGLTDGSHCKTCGDVFSEQKVIPALGHDYRETVVESTCTVDGYVKHECTRCGDYYLDDIVATGHKISIVETPATCTEEGLKVTTCFDCDLYLEEVLSIIDHTESDWIIDKKATCEEKGEKHTVCTVCEQEVKREIVSELGHNYAYKVYEPTCIEGGKTFYYCLNCGHNYYGDETDSTGHNLETSEVSLTCTTDGCTINSCNKCEYIERNNIIKAHGHTFDYEIGSCTTCGKLCCEDLIYELNETNSGYYIVGINDTTETDIIVPAKFNNLPVVGVKQQAIDNKENIVSITLPNTIKFIDKYAFYDCDNLEYLYINSGDITVGGPRIIYYCENLVRISFVGSFINWIDLDIELNENVEVEYELGHKYELISETHATCTEDGVLTYKCYHCNDTYEAYEEAFGHNIDEESPYIEPTCTEVGYKSGTCTVCGHDSTVEIEALGHSIEYQVITEATCIQDGLEKGVCSVCGYEDERPLMKQGHIHSDFISDGELCGDKEIGNIYCLICKDIIYQFGHKYNKKTILPTCTEEGYYEYSCINCEHSYKIIISALGHIDGDVKVLNQPTCTEKGQESVYCLVCSEILRTNEIYAHGHMYSSNIENEKIVYSCKSCDNSYEQIIEKEYYTIKFETNGGNQISDLIIQDNINLLLPNPIKEGYIFNGWYFDEELTNLYLDGEEILEDVTLYASWASETFVFEYETNNFEQSVPLEFTFEVSSTVDLELDNIDLYLKVLDGDNNPVELILSECSNIYTISSNKYINGVTYHVIASDEITLIGRSSNEFYFVTEFDECVDIIYKDNVVKVNINDTLILEEDDNDYIYVATYEDLLSVGDSAVVIGEIEHHIYALFEVVKEDYNGSYYEYVSIPADPSQIYEKCDIYVNETVEFDDMDLSQFDTETYTQLFEKSELYEQLNEAAKRYAKAKSNYKVEKPTISPIVNKVSGGFVAGFNVKFKFQHKTNKTYIEIIFSVKDKITINSSKNGSLLRHDLNGSVTATNVLTIDIAVKLGAASENTEDPKSIIKQISSIIKQLKNEKDFSSLKNDPAESEYSVPLMPTQYIGPIAVDLNITTSWETVGQLGIEYENVTNITAGFKLYKERQIVKKKNIFGKTVYREKEVKKSEIYGDFENKNTFSTTLMGKIRVSSGLELDIYFGIKGVFALGVTAEAGPYYEFGGFITAGITIGEGGYVKGGLYVEAGIYLKIEAYVDIIFTDGLHINIVNKDYALANFGEREVPLDFEISNEEYNITASFGKNYSIKNLANIAIKYYKFKEMEFESKDSDKKYYFYKYGDVPKNVKISSDGILKIEAAEDTIYKFKVKVSCGEFEKIITINVKIDHMHAYEETKIVTGCLVQNESIFKCSCGLSYNEIKPAPGHSMEYISHKDATCTKDGHTEGKYCENCDYVEIKSTTITAKGHKYTEWSIVDPTCTEDGYKVRSCTVCKEEFKETIPALKHIEVIDKGYAPKCEEEGLTDGKHCSRCQEVLVKQEAIKSTGHTNSTWIIDSESTCEEKGLKHIECIVCHKILVEEYTNALGHLEVINDSKNPTCTEIGWDTYVTCSRCDYTTYVEIPKKNHNYGEWIDELSPTCEKEGILAHYHCDQCDKDFDKNLNEITKLSIEALGHTYGEWIDEVSSTCEKEGKLAHYHCEICVKNFDINKNEITSLVIEATGHIYGEWIEEISPTCETEGKLAHYHCSKCNKDFDINKLIIENIIISCIEHNFVDNICVYCELKNGSDGLKYVISDNNTYYIVAGIGTCKDTEIIIPNIYNNIPVREIKSNAFSYQKNIISVKISNGIEIVGDNAFNKCTSLVNVEMPKTVTYIGHNAFYECKSLNDIVIPEGVTYIGNQAFRGCVNIININIPNSVVEIGSQAFTNCDNLLLNEYDNAYYLGNETNKYHALVSSKDGAYTSCLINEETKVIAGTAFAGRQYIRNIEIPDKVLSIGSQAFRGCSEIKSMVIPNSVIYIRYEAFGNCDLTNLTLGTGVKIIDNNAFNNCRFSNIIIPDSVMYIGNSVFFGCQNLETINIGQGVSYIGESVFWCCEKLSQITVDLNNEKFKSIDGNLYTKDGETLLQYALAKSSEKFVVPNGVKYISSYAFRGCENLVQVIMSNSLKSIGEYAFADCIALESLVIDKNMIDICHGAFYRSTQLKNIYYLGNKENWNNITIDTSNDPLENAIIYFHSETKPLDEGYYWHYNNNEIVIWQFAETVIYTITFDSNGGTSVDNIEFFNEFDDFELPTPVREGYDFIGWYEDGILFETLECRNYNLVAIWEKIEEKNKIEIYVENGIEYLNFGRYPQTVVNDEMLINELNKIEENEFGYIEYNGNEYKANKAYSYDTIFINGVPIINDKIYYFLVEPIKWRILESNNGVLKIVSSLIIDNVKFYTSRDERIINEEIIYPNNYEYSSIRAWLNGYDGTKYNVENYLYKGFIDFAFSTDERTIINQTFVDNSALTTGKYDNRYICNDTTDYIYILSCADLANNEYLINDLSNLNNSTEGLVSDYARSKYCTVLSFDNCLGKGNWWLRSPYYLTGTYVSRFGNYGHTDNGFEYIDWDRVGVRPVLTISI